jgi:translation initiation factor 2 gamma subunit (eIF-2gamma)
VVDSAVVLVAAQELLPAPHGHVHERMIAVVQPDAFILEVRTITLVQAYHSL